MSWIAITETQVRTRRTGPELAALKTAALAPGQADPLPAVIAGVIQRVRGYCAAGGFALGAGETIPGRLEDAALALIRFELAGRLPVAAMLTEDRRKAAEDARALLRDVARGLFAIDVPDTPTTEVSNAPRPSVTRATRTFGITDQNGL